MLNLQLIKCTKVLFFYFILHAQRQCIKYFKLNYRSQCRDERSVSLSIPEIFEFLRCCPTVTCFRNEWRNNYGFTFRFARARINN